ncbi:MAG: HD domain-containing phosphohydrolase [Magnetospirillum sp.]
MEQWLRFLDIDSETTTTLRDFAPQIAPHMDAIMDTLYARIALEPKASALFKTPQSMARARELQKRHWMEYVFTGKFDAEYLRTTRSIGETHYRVGVDLMFYKGAYSVLQIAVQNLVDRLLADNPEARRKVQTALGKAITLDKGLATSVYYDSMVGALEEMSNELNFSLARAGEFRDNETGKHIMRMSRMCQALALALGQDSKWAQMVLIASPLHDVGKIGIPDNILLKPGRLDDQELAIMRQHPGIGGDIIPDNAAEVIRMARRISLTHHEKWDGSGYPAGLRGEEIPLEGRIASICDVYDALVSARPYKTPWPREKALAYLQENAGTQFDPHLVTVFLSIMADIDLIQSQYREDEQAAKP